RILCKFFIHGACLKGEYCEFSHDWQDQPNNICTFYQKGVCSYGSRCRYDHVKVSHHQTSGPSPSNSHPHVTSDSHQATCPSVVSLTREYNPQLSTSIDVTSMSPLHTFCCTSAWTKKLKHCLHPFRPNESEDHIKMCDKNNKHLEALKCSQEIECSVCLERVLSKPTAAERKFGVLPECDHPFCISCIRNWRSNSPASGMNVNSALRACPICRQLSYFVIPSVIWYSTKEEKQAIIDSYKTKLKSIDCKYFDFGIGTCPFGTSCFYKVWVTLIWSSFSCFLAVRNLYFLSILFNYNLAL
ncbi:hypothetical protein BHE74_00010245, partial [Ensete ventricosum]